MALEQKLSMTGLIILLSLQALGVTSKPNQKLKELTTTPKPTFEVKESTVDIQGKKFKKLELKNEVYFIETLAPTNTNDEIRVLCQQGLGEDSAALVSTGVKVTERSSLVIEGIRQVCKNASNGRKELDVDPSILVGLQIETGKNKKQKWIISPFGINFKADW